MIEYIDFNEDDSMLIDFIFSEYNNSIKLNSLSSIDLESCKKEASDSLIEFDRMDEQTEVNFEEFINSYNAKI